MVDFGQTKIPTKYIGLIKDMYNNVVTRVRTSNGDTDDFPMTSRLGYDYIKG